ncbi:MAG: hypothetical protein HY901_14985 [Deltaproteobacteria bacterium]|nr:hypothetical protein [Deltaproteobacteria bacterium]
MTMSSHPSKFALEQLFVGDLPDEERDRAAGHVEHCAECRKYLGELKGVTEQQLGSLPPPFFMTRLRARRAEGERRGWKLARLWAMGPVAAAVAAMLLLIPRGTVEPLDHAGLKGSGVVLHLKRGEQTRLLGEAEKVRGGDALRLVLLLDQPQRVAVWFVDASGRVDRFHDAQSLALEAGEQVLAGSAVVDSPCRDLWLVVARGEAASADGEQALRRGVAAKPTSPADWAPPQAIVRALSCE